MRHHAKCCADRSNRCRDIVIFNFFRMSAAAILDFFKFELVTDQTVTRAEMRYLPNFVEIAETAAEIWRFFDFSKWRPPPCWIFEITDF